MCLSMGAASLLAGRTALRFAEADIGLRLGQLRSSCTAVVEPDAADIGAPRRRECIVWSGLLWWLGCHATRSVSQRERYKYRVTEFFIILSEGCDRMSARGHVCMWCICGAASAGLRCLPGCMLQSIRGAEHCWAYASVAMMWHSDREITATFAVEREDTELQLVASQRDVELRRERMKYSTSSLT